MEENKVIDVEPIEESKPTLDTGNYIIEVISDGNIIKKLAATNSAINITKLADGGLTIDLK